MTFDEIQMLRNLLGRVAMTAVESIWANGLLARLELEARRALQRRSTDGTDKTDGGSESESES